MDQKIEVLIDKYSSCPKEEIEDRINGNAYLVTRHFTGGKNINDLVFRLAVERADREMGL